MTKPISEGTGLAGSGPPGTSFRSPVKRNPRLPRVADRDRHHLARLWTCAVLPLQLAQDRLLDRRRDVCIEIREPQAASPWATSDRGLKRAATAFARTQCESADAGTSASAPPGGVQLSLTPHGPPSWK
jgi:hypothetical protein